MIIAIASGKGGTGKTTVAVNLALSVEGSVRLLDCDVEEPNCHLFLKPEITSSETLGVPVPVVDQTKCDGCGKCAQVCQYNALAALKTGVLVFPELCHGCGGCMLVCPKGAITEGSREIGVLETGRAGHVAFVHGRLRVGEAMAPPLIRAVKKHATGDMVNIIDAPPGTSCPVITAVRGCDYVILVTEPTPFGLHDLTLAVETVRQMGLPFGVLVNRADIGDDRVRGYCATEDIRILAEIPDDRRIAEAYSRGEPAVSVLPEYRQVFHRLWADIKRAACGVCQAAVRVTDANV
jgi:MinD superfamily P-loop ATPase